MSQSQLRVNSAMGFFCPMCVQGLPRSHLWGISNFRQEVKGSSKMATDGTANQNCSFEAANLKNPYSQSELFFYFQMAAPPMEAAIFRGRTSFTPREANTISSRCLQDGNPNTAIIKWSFSSVMVGCCMWCQVQNSLHFDAIKMVSLILAIWYSGYWYTHRDQLATMVCPIQRPARHSGTAVVVLNAM